MKKSALEIKQKLTEDGGFMLAFDIKEEKNVIIRLSDGSISLICRASGEIIGTCSDYNEFFIQKHLPA